MNTNGDVVKSVWIDDPTYTGTRNYTDTSTTGFIKVLETSAMAPGTVNTNTTLEANATTSTGQPFFNNTGSAAAISAAAALPTTGQADDEHNHVRAYGTDDAAGVANSLQIYLGFNGLNPSVAPTFLTGGAKSLYVTYQTDPSQSATNVSVQLWNDVVRQTQTTHYYEPATGNVIVHYIDEEGNVIKNPVNDETNAPVNKQYDTEDKREQTITFNGSTYTYVKPKENNTTGKVVEGTTDVTYIYRKVVPQGNVVVHYIDEDGNVIKNPVNDETNVPVGTNYNTEDKREQKITFNGETYTYVKSKENNTTGTVTNGTTNVTYIYRKETKPVTPTKPEDPKKVTTIWVTVTGKVLRQREDGTKPRDNFNGYRFVRTEVDKDGNTTHIYEPVTTLARTGSNVATIAAIAGGVTVLGIAVVAAARMRKRD